MRPYNEFQPVSSDGWVLMPKGVNIVDTVFPAEWTVKTIKTLSLMVDMDCYILLNGKRMFIDKRLGLHISSEFRSIKTLEFETDGISAYFLGGY